MIHSLLAKFRCLFDVIASRPV